VDQFENSYDQHGYLNLLFFIFFFQKLLPLVYLCFSFSFPQSLPLFTLYMSSEGVKIAYTYSDAVAMQRP
jgi:hypothetical protein